jgi:hypothetical protein
MYTKAEWLTILALSTLWHFHQIRKLAIQHLEEYDMTEMELIRVGRATSISSWVLAGFKSIAGRPRGCIISDEEAGVIGHRAAHQLSTIRYQLAVRDLDSCEDLIENELLSRFSQELGALKTAELEHRTEADIERGEPQEKREKEARVIAERQKFTRAELWTKEEAGRMEHERLAKAERVRGVKAQSNEVRRPKEGRLVETQKGPEAIELDPNRMNKVRLMEAILRRELDSFDRLEKEEVEERRRREREDKVRRRLAKEKDRRRREIRSGEKREAEVKTEGEREQGKLTEETGDRHGQEAAESEKQDTEAIEQRGSEERGQ